MNKIIISILLMMLLTSCKSANVVTTVIVLSDFDWHIQISNNSMNFNSIELIESQIYVSDFHADSLFVLNIKGEYIDKKERSDSCNPNRFIWDYIEKETIIHSDSIAYSDFYHIQPQNTDTILELQLESYREKERGVDNIYYLNFVDNKKRKYKLKFEDNASKGAFMIYDVVPYSATKFVISFWYYERYGVSNTQLGVLDLSQYIE